VLDARIAATFSQEPFVAAQEEIGAMNANLIESSFEVAVQTLAAERLRSAPYRSLRSVDCAFRGGVLTLRGRLESFYLKQMAQACVSPIEPVHIVDNQIEVVEIDPRASGPMEN
jgi:hypothetical protein